MTEQDHGDDDDALLWEVIQVEREGALCGRGSVRWTACACEPQLE